MLAWATQASKNRISTLKFPSQICLGMTKERGRKKNGPDPYGSLTWYLQLLLRITVSHHYKVQRVAFTGKNRDKLKCSHQGEDLITLCLVENSHAHRSESNSQRTNSVPGCLMLK